LQDFIFTLERRSVTGFGHLHGDLRWLLLSFWTSLDVSWFKPTGRQRSSVGFSTSERPKPVIDRRSMRSANFGAKAVLCVSPVLFSALMTQHGFPTKLF
jgi:hypothetical protein